MHIWALSIEGITLRLHRRKIGALPIGSTMTNASRNYIAFEARGCESESHRCRQFVYMNGVQGELVTRFKSQDFPKKNVFMKHI
jgi:hypothetical protein